MDYLDFDLEIGEGIGRNYPTSVRSPAGQAHGILHFPFDTLELDNYLLRLQNALLGSGGTRRKLLTPHEQAVQYFGQKLFEALLVDNFRNLYYMSRREAKRQGKGLRLRLHVLPAELAALPWEYLYDPREADYLCLSRQTPLVRYLDLPHPVEPLAVAPPLHLLAMIANPSDQDDLNVAREQERMRLALATLEAQGLLSLNWVEGQTWRDLHRALETGSWHLFHFIGHGGFDTRREEGVLALANERGKTELIYATALARLLADHVPLRFVLLNACEGAKGGQHDLFSSTASTLARRGIPAVLAMQAEITDQAAIECTRAFYEGLATGQPVDTAVARARKAISMAVNNSLEWGTPVLFLHASDGTLFQLSEMVSPVSGIVGARAAYGSTVATALPSITETTMETSANIQPLLFESPNIPNFSDRSSNFPAPPGGWTPDADNYLVDFYLSRSDGELAQHLAVPPESIGVRLETLGLIGIRPTTVHAPRNREPHQEAWANPYVIGPPITNPKMFYGRERELEFIRSNLNHTNGENQSRAIVLVGQKRVGKTSLLHRLEDTKSASSILAPRIPIYLPIDRYIPFTSASLFYKLSHTIYQAMVRRKLAIAQPQLTDFQHDFGSAWHRFLDNAEESTGGAGLVLLLDEFQIIEERRVAADLDKDIFWVLRTDMQSERHIDFILAGTMQMEDIVRSHDAALFGIGPSLLLGPLDEESARHLIREPVRAKKITFDEDAVDLIIAVTSCYSYHVQFLCSILFNYLNERQKLRVTYSDIERVLPKVLEEANTSISSILYANEVSPLERYILAGAAELILVSGGSCQYTHLLDFLKKKELPSKVQDFEEALRKLELRNLIKTDKAKCISFEIDLYRQWLRANRPLKRVVSEGRVRL